jgi:large subunit ribosomal protein L6
MSKIGNKPIKIPEGVKIALNGKVINFEGKKGKLSLNIFDGIKVEVKDGSVYVTKEKQNTNALHGTMRAKINNSILGVNDGFSKVLEISGVGFRAEDKGNLISLQLGFSHPVVVDKPKGIDVKIDSKLQNVITISGSDKELVGNFADKIKKLKLPEPYKGSGIKYQNERIIRKSGKAQATAGAAGAKK